MFDCPEQIAEESSPNKSLLSICSNKLKSSNFKNPLRSGLSTDVQSNNALGGTVDHSYIKFGSQEDLNRYEQLNRNTMPVEFKQSGKEHINHSF